MKKKIIALAIAAAVSSPAFADSGNVTVYGMANVSFDLVDNGSNGATSGTRNNKVSSNASRIGFKGAEDMGEGLKAVWQTESLISLDGAAADSFGTRNTYAGLSSDKLGTVLLGRYDTPYKISTRKLDIFSDSIGDNRSLLGSIAGTSSYKAFDGRQTDTIVYTSPAFNGFTVAAAYVAGAETASTSANSKGSAWSLAGWYDAAPFYGSLAYEVHDVGSTGTGTMAGASNTATVYAHTDSRGSAFKLGAGYQLGAFDLKFAYEKTSDNLGGTGAPTGAGSPGAVTGADVFGHNAYYLAGKYNIGSDAVKVAYSHAGNLAGAAAGADTSANAPRYLLCIPS